MAAQRSQAIVLRVTDVFETSQVVSLFTREAGQISGLAKGSRRLKGPFQCALDLLSLVDIVWLPKRDESLDLLTEAVLLERFACLRRELPAFYAGNYVAELLSGLTDLKDPHPKLFDAAIVTLRHLGDPALRYLRLLRFELALMRELGHMPSLELCVGCNAAVGGDRGVDFGMAVGGVLCPDCRDEVDHVARLTASTLEALKQLARPGLGWQSLELNLSQRRSARMTIGAVISHVLGRRPKLLSYLGA